MLLVVILQVPYMSIKHIVYLSCLHVKYNVSTYTGHLHESYIASTGSNHLYPFPHLISSQISAHIF